MTDVIPSLWFDVDAEAAIGFYTSLIPDSEVISLSRYPDEVPVMGGKVMQAHLPLAGRDYSAKQAMFTMTKIDIAAIEAAADGS